MPSKGETADTHNNDNLVKPCFINQPFYKTYNNKKGVYKLNYIRKYNNVISYLS